MWGTCPLLARSLEVSRVHEARIQPGRYCGRKQGLTSHILWNWLPPSPKPLGGQVKLTTLRVIDERSWGAASLQITSKARTRGIRFIQLLGDSCGVETRVLESCAAHSSHTATGQDPFLWVITLHRAGQPSHGGQEGGRKA